MRECLEMLLSLLSDWRSISEDFLDVYPPFPAPFARTWQPFSLLHAPRRPGCRAGGKVFSTGCVGDLRHLGAPAGLFAERWRSRHRGSRLQPSHALRLVPTCVHPLGLHRDNCLLVSINQNWSTHHWRTRSAASTAGAVRARTCPPAQPLFPQGDGAEPDWAAERGQDQPGQRADHGAVPRGHDPHGGCRAAGPGPRRARWGATACWERGGAQGQKASRYRLC